MQAIVVTTAADLKRVKNNIPLLIERLPVDRITFVGSEEVGTIAAEYSESGKVSFIDENSIIPFDDVHAVMKEVLKTPLVPRGVTGWYYQQFLKMQFSSVSESDYYLTWDGDTVPCKSFSMFSEDGKPYFDLKTEYHEEYFITMQKLLGMGKVIGKSFISEHMLFNVQIMKELIKTIEANTEIPGSTFYEKILHSIRDGQVDSNSFSEFETYGTFVALKHQQAYKLRDWHSLRYGAMYFKPDEMTQEDFDWLSPDFDAISFEKGDTYDGNYAELLHKPEYRAKLTARQIVEIIQEESSEGMKEVWEDGTNPIEFNDEETNPEEFLFYNYLGDSLRKQNANQAFLCYENALFLCNDDNVKTALREKMDILCSQEDISVRKLGIVIVSYNAKTMMKDCIASIRRYVAPDSYDIVVVDNASNDGVTLWLEKQNDITLVKNPVNEGFPKGCNRGISEVPDDDIFLLNNDTRLCHNSVFWLRMGLYESSVVGATGAISNYVCLQQRDDITLSLPDDYLRYGRKVNVFMSNPYEKVNRLSGFALMLKREALNEAGGLNEELTPGFFEDDDLSFELVARGWALYICHNSFIYHAGSQGFSKRTDLNTIYSSNHRKICDKWGFDLHSFSNIYKDEKEALQFIAQEGKQMFRLLEIGAGCGNMLAKISYYYPNAVVIGAERSEDAIRMAGTSSRIICMDEWEKLPFCDGYFDYIIYNERFGSDDPDIDRLHSWLDKYLSTDGVLLVTK